MGGKSKIGAIRSFIEIYASDYPSVDAISDTSDILAYFEWEGDDAEEFLEAFCDAFNVNMDKYLWYFHHQDEPPGRGFINSIIQRPWMRVERMPITIIDLAETIKSGEWSMEYPKHDISIPRKEIILGVFVFAILPLSVIIWL